MANNNLNAENVRLQEKIKKLEKENKRLKRIIQAVREFVEANAQFAQQKMLSGGLGTGVVEWDLTKKAACHKISW